MTFETFLLYGIGAVCGILGWFARELYSATQSLRKDLSALEVQISRDYVRYDRLQDALKPITQALDDIKAALIHKQDKP